MDEQFECNEIKRSHKEAAFVKLHGKNENPQSFSVQF